MLETKTVAPWRRYLGMLLDYLIVFYTILGTQSVYNNASGREYHILPLTAVFLALHILLFPDILKWQNFKRFLFVAVPWAVYILIYAAVAGGDRVKLIEKFVIVLLLYAGWMFGHFLREDIKEVFRYYVQIIFIIALISVFMWFTASTLKWFLPSDRFHMYWGKERRIWSFYGIYFHWQNDFFIHGHRFYRNIGIFTEAPMFSLHLTSALTIDVLLNTRKSRFRYFRIIWFCGTILTTFSITGYLFMMVLIAVDIYASLIVRAMSQDPAVRKRANRELVAISVLALILGGIGYALVADKLASRSGGSRMEDYNNGYKGWRDNVWFGAGFGDIEARQRYASWRRLHRSESGFTNSPMAILCEGGIWFFLCYYVPIAYELIAGLNRKDWRAMFAVLMFIFLFVTTTMEHTNLMLAFLGFSLAHFLSGGHKENAPLIGRPLVVPEYHPYGEYEPYVEEDA